MKPRTFTLLWLRTLKWFKSVHAKLFLVTGLLTSLLILAMAYTITDNSRKEMLDYTRDLAIQTALVERRATVVVNPGDVLLYGSAATSGTTAGGAHLANFRLVAATKTAKLLTLSRCHFAGFYATSRKRNTGGEVGTPCKPFPPLRRLLMLASSRSLRGANRLTNRR